MPCPIEIFLQKCITKHKVYFFSNQSRQIFLKSCKFDFFFHLQKNKQNFSWFHFVSHKLVGCGKELTFPGLNLHQVLAIILTAWHILLYQWYILKNEEKAFILYERGKAKKKEKECIAVKILQTFKVFSYVSRGL